MFIMKEETSITTMQENIRVRAPNEPVVPLTEEGVVRLIIWLNHLGFSMRGFLSGSPWFRVFYKI